MVERFNTQITDHSSELDDMEDSEVMEHPEDDLTAILRAKDAQIRVLQLGNLCFQKRAKYFESKVEELKTALEEASYRFSGINQVLGITKVATLAEAELIGVFKVLELMADEGESSIDHELALADLPSMINSESESEG